MQEVISSLEELIWAHVFKRLAWDLPYYKYTLNIHRTIKYTFAWGFGNAAHIASHADSQIILLSSFL